MAEEVNEGRWEEVCRWAEEEWVGGASIIRNEDLNLYAMTGAMSLKFKTYKHWEDSRILYQIVLLVPGLGKRANFIVTLTGENEAPDSLEEFLVFYAKYNEEVARTNKELDMPYFLRLLRKDIRLAREDPGYKSLAEVYEYVLSQLRTPVEHAELHTDVADYEESINVEAVSKKGSEKLSRTLALFLQWVRAFKPDFADWEDLEDVVVTADNPVWKGGGGGILKIVHELNVSFPLNVSTAYYRNLSLKMPSGYSRGIEREIDVKRVLTDKYKIQQIETLNAREASNWSGPVFRVEINDYISQLTRTLRFRFLKPEAVPSVASLAGVHSFKFLGPAQISDVEIFTRAAEELGLDNPVGRAAAIRQGAMGYAESGPEIQLAALRKPGLREKVNRAGIDFVSAFTTEHGELHTDTGAYDESLSQGINFSKAELDFAMEKWLSFPDSERGDTASKECYSFIRSFSEIPNKLHFTLWPPSNFSVYFMDMHKGLSDLNDIPDPLADYFIAQLENSETRRRLKAVKPATAAHWGKQFLLGINLERKVPESAFPSKPVAELPAYFDKFRFGPSESDLRLALTTDLSLLGE